MKKNVRLFNYERGLNFKGYDLKKIIVFFGGKSTEHDISVITGTLTVNSLDKEKFSPVPVYVDKNGRWWTGKAACDVRNFKDGDPKDMKRVALFSGDNVLYALDKKIKALCGVYGAINCMHGRNGEDGTIAAVCRLSGIPLASSDMFSSALAMDKEMTRKCVSALGVRIADGFAVTREDYYSDAANAFKNAERIGYPVIVKPANSGSSIGVSVARDQDEFTDSLSLAFRFDVKVVVEKFLQGAKDVNCAAYRSGGKIRVSECETAHGGMFLSFGDKYLGSKTGGGRRFPADIDERLSEEIKKTTADVYNAFGFSGIVRIDYLLCDGKVYLGEINSVPGSLAYYLFCNKISEFTDLLTDLLTESHKNFLEYEHSETTFKSSVLSISGAGVKK